MRTKKREKQHTHTKKKKICGPHYRKVLGKYGFQVNWTFYIQYLAEGIDCVKKFSVMSRYLINLRLLGKSLLENKFHARLHIVCSFLTNALPQLLLFDDLTVFHTPLGNQKMIPALSFCI